MNKEEYSNFAHEKVAELRTAILDKVGERNIIFYGASYGALWLGKILTDDVVQKKVAYILDTAPNVQGNYLFGKQVQGPEILHNLNMDDYVILISAINASQQIAQMLTDTYGIKQGIHFLNYTHLYWQYFSLHFDLDYSLAIFDFIDRAHATKFPTIETPSSNEEIGILINYSVPNGILHAGYAIALYLLLRYQGYKVRLVLDDLCDTSYYPMYQTDLVPGLFDELPLTKEQQPIVYIAFDTVISYLCDVFGDVVCDRLSNIVHFERERLSADDLMFIDSYTEQTYLAKRFYKSFVHKEKFKLYCKQYAGYISAYLRKKPVSSVIMFNGMANETGILTYFGQIYGIRTPSYDGAYEYGVGKILLSANKCCCHWFDITRAILENLFSEDEKKKLTALGKEIFQYRIAAHVTPPEKQNTACEYAYMSYQPTQSEDYGHYDIVMPLNLPTDAAAIGIPGVFSTMRDWVFETLDYILSCTTATVLVRMHPVQVQLEETGVFAARKISVTMAPIKEDFDDEILKRFGNHPRLKFVSSDEPCNTYQVIKECKLVLPHSSTLGIESALMGKAVLLARDNYYADLGFAVKATSKKDYFKKIDQLLMNTPKPLSQDALDTAYMVLACITYGGLQTDFVPFITLQSNLEPELLPWQRLTIEELIKVDGVKEILDIFAENIPSCVLKMRKVFKNLNRKA